MAQFAGTNLSSYFAKPDFKEIGQQAIEGSFLERAVAEAASISAEMNKDIADTQLYMDKNQAKVTRAQGAQQARGMVQDAVVGGLQSLGGAAISRWGKTSTPKSNSSTSFGSTPMTFNTNYDWNAPAGTYNFFPMGNP